MSDATHIMAKEAAERYRAKFKKDTEKWSGLTIPAFTSEQAKQDHLRYVEEFQAQGGDF
jgi:hypothetical protein